MFIKFKYLSKSMDGKGALMNGTLTAVISIVLLCFILALFLSTISSVNYEEYTFEYTYNESIGGSDVEAAVKRCVSFDSTKTNLEATTQKFIKDHDKKGKLTVKELCDKDVFGTPVYQKVTYALDDNNTLHIY